MGNTLRKKKVIIMRLTWYENNKFVSDRLLTNDAYKAIVRVLSGQETVTKWYIAVGADPAVEDIYDTTLYDEMVRKEATITLEETDEFSRIRFDATIDTTDVTEAIGELGLLLETNNATYLVDRTSYGPQELTESKTFTAILEFHRR